MKFHTGCECCVELQQFPALCTHAFYILPSRFRFLFTANFAKPMHVT